MPEEIRENIAIVRGASMLPVLETGNVVQLLPIERSAIHRGDIIVFRKEDNIAVIHRVICTSPLQTMGENNVSPDAPMPHDIPLFCATHVLIDGKPVQLKHGRIGWWQFCLHRAQWHIRHRISNRLRQKVSSVLRRLARFFPWRTPFGNLTHASFPGKEVYYRGHRAVGWIDASGWHWLGRSWLRVRAPNSDEIKSCLTNRR